MDLWNGRPEAVLVQSPVPAHEVDAPGLNSSIAELQGLERDGDLRRPARLYDAGGNVPHAVPVGVGLLPLVERLIVVFGRHRIRLERVAVAAIVERVQDGGDGIDGARVVVTGQVADDELVRLVVVGLDADIQVLVVVENPDLGIESGGLPLPGLSLDEVLGHRGCPGRC